MRVVLAAVVVLVSSSALAQNCRRIGNQIFCDNGVSSSQIGNSTFYNYPDERRAKQQDHQGVRRCGGAFSYRNRRKEITSCRRFF